jgi:hypothetical protein
MKPKQIIAAVALFLVVVYFLTRNSSPQTEARKNANEKVEVVSSTYQSHDFQPDIENYRLEREQIQQHATSEPRHKPEFKNAPEYKVSNLRAKITPGPIDDFGAPLFVPSETAMTDPKIFEQELAKHHERSDSYTAARMDELKLNTQVEKQQMRGVIDNAIASGSKSPEEIKRAEDAYARMQMLEKVLSGEKVDKILE